MSELQVKLMLRLKREEVIVGYFAWVNGDIYRAKGKTIPDNFSEYLALGPTTRIQHDSFDIGIRDINNDDRWAGWIFEDSLVD